MTRVQGEKFLEHRLNTSLRIIPRRYKAKSKVSLEFFHGWSIWKIPACQRGILRSGPFINMEDQENVRLQADKESTGPLL